MRNCLLLSFLLLFCLQINAQETRSALFLGNSYTNFNQLPVLVADIADSFGDSLIHNQNTPGGYTLQAHSTDASTLTLINSQPWDYVILQGQSQRPSFPPSQVAQQVYPYAATLVQQMKANDSCTTPLFFMTWGRKNGDQQNCANYPPLCTYEGMQDRLRTSYLTMTQTHAGDCAPVGAAWKYTRDNSPGIELYNPDESHPSLAGSYLAACVFYASIFHKSPVGAPAPGALDPARADTLQQYAAHVVLDSLPTWFIDTSAVVAAFGASAAQLNVTFSNNSLNATDWWWDFGDGNTFQGQSPAHTYATSGTYTVTLIAGRDCLRDTVMDTVNVTALGIEPEEGGGIRLYPNPAEGYFSLDFAGTDVLDLQIMDVRGIVLRNFTGIGPGHRLPTRNLPTGIYFVRVQNQEKTGVLRLRIE